jgi:hypothetical protein
MTVSTAAAKRRGIKPRGYRGAESTEKARRASVRSPRRVSPHGQRV